MSKKTIFLFAIVLTISMSAFAQGAGVSADSSAAPIYRFSFGIGPEFNMNSPDGFAGGGGFFFDFGFGNSLAVGLIASASHNFNETTVLEISNMLRYYLLKAEHTGFFYQAELGSTIIFDDDDGVIPAFMGGFRTGARIGFGLGYFEPYVRIGYPFAFGVGFNSGLRFEVTGLTPEEKAAKKAAKAEASEAKRAAKAESAEAKRAAKAESAEAKRTASEAAAEARRIERESRDAARNQAAAGN